MATFVQNRKCQGANHTASEFMSPTFLGKGKKPHKLQNDGTQIPFFGGGDVRWMGSGSYAWLVRKPNFWAT